MVPIAQLTPGTRVKVVDQWNDFSYESYEGKMDKYLGKIVTILCQEFPDCVLIEEDFGDDGYGGNGHWLWNEYCFEHIVENEARYAPEDFEPSSEQELFMLIFGEEYNKGGDFVRGKT